MKPRLCSFRNIAPALWNRWVRTQAITKSVIALTCVGGLVALNLLPAPVSNTIPATQFFTTITANPSQLSDDDALRYHQAFREARAGDANALLQTISTIHNQQLLGYVLAEEYLSGRYTASKEELADWLANYNDHPQATRIRQMAAARGIKAPAPDLEKPLKGAGYAEHLGRTTMPDGWYRGLALWREANYAQALNIFSSIANDKAASGWQKAASHYWAYRSADKLNQDSLAQNHLKQAAVYKTTFYGLLAIQQTGGRFAEAHAPAVGYGLRNHPRAIRASLLTQLDYTNEAEEELRILYTALEPRARAGIITLAHELNLANLQVRLAKLDDLSDEEEIFASYPVPQYVLDAQVAQSSALLLAIARNESGFRETAASGAGAVGLMQILPSTAHSIERRVGLEALQLTSADASLAPIAQRLNDPATSVRYSAQYLGILAQQQAVGTNLVRVLAAYNAGPGTVANWQSMAQNIQDPLLYIESIPYPETRNYVMQVLAHSWVYATILGEDTTTLQALAAGKWPELATSSQI